MKCDFLPFGFLPIYKPVGPTSHDIVAQVRRLLPRKLKVGHTGTLDPFASGVLVLALGKATRFADAVHGLRKRYRAEIRLGERTDSLDPTGEVDLSLPVPVIQQGQLDALAATLIGTQDQFPPAYSAKRVSGRRSYELARQNKQVPLKACRITLYHLKLQLMEAALIACDTQCSTGTYIRSLGRDISEKLGTCGSLHTLERTSVGLITVEDCAHIDQLDNENLPGHLWTVSRLLPEFPEWQLPEEAYRYLIQGQPFQTKDPAPTAFLGISPDSEGQTRAIFRCYYDPVLAQITSKHLCYISA